MSRTIPARSRLTRSRSSERCEPSVAPTTPGSTCLRQRAPCLIAATRADGPACAFTLRRRELALEMYHALQAVFRRSGPPFCHLLPVWSLKTDMSTRRRSSQSSPTMRVRNYRCGARSSVRLPVPSCHSLSRRCRDCRAAPTSARSGPSAAEGSARVPDFHTLVLRYSLSRALRRHMAHGRNAPPCRRSGAAVRAEAPSVTGR